MQFMKALRPRVKSGEVTTSIRIWQSARVSAGKRYPLEGGFVAVDRVREIEIADVTPEMARASGFAGLVDLLKTAKHGAGTRVFLIDFHYEDA